MENSNLFHNLLTWVCLFWPLQEILAYPIPTDVQNLNQDEYFWLNSELIFVISLVSVITSITLVFACLCCERGVFKPRCELEVFENVHNGAKREGYIGAAHGTEFTIFPPHGSDHERGSLNDIKFEPLPDIRPRGGKSNSLRPKPASFCNVISRGLLVEDWFDDPSSNFPRNQLQYIQELGCGWFGQVVEGEAQGICRNSKKTKIVVKILREDATPTDQIYFLHEVKAFRDLNHPNIMRLVAKCLETDPFLIVLEHCAFRDLKTYLTQHRTESESLIQENLLLRMMCNVASGLSHMHENNFIHTDLAARNCLVGADLQVKIGDYGNSIDKFKDDYYCAADMAVAIRWCAPESLRCTETTIETKEVTHSANVWSLGVVLWEILEFARMPYYHLNEEDVLQKVVIDKTETLRQPATLCAHKDKIFQVMQLCWGYEPDLRPRTDQIYVMLTHLYDNCDSTKQIDFETRWNALQPVENVTLSNLTRDVVDLMSSRQENGRRFENDFTPHPPPSSHRTSSLDFPGSSSLSPSLQNLRGSLDELNAETTSTLSAETSLSDTNLNNAFNLRDVSYSSKARSSSVDLSHLSGRSVQREFNAWLETEQTKGDEASRIAQQISDAMGTLDAALADEKCTSSEDSNQATPERELTTHEEKVNTEETSGLTSITTTDASQSIPTTTTTDASQSISTTTEVRSPVLTAVESTEVTTTAEAALTSTSEPTATNAAVFQELATMEPLTSLTTLTRDKAPSIQDFLKLTVIESETSDSDGAPSLNSEGAANQIPLTQLCTLPVVVTGDDVVDSKDEIISRDCPPSHVDDVLDSIPTNAEDLNLPDALSLTSVSNTNESDGEKKIELDWTLNFRSTIKEDDEERHAEDDVEGVDEDKDDGIELDDITTTMTTDIYEEEEEHCDRLKSIHCLKCQNEIGQLIEDLVKKVDDEVGDEKSLQLGHENEDKGKEIEQTNGNDIESALQEKESLVLSNNSEENESEMVVEEKELSNESKNDFVMVNKNDIDSCLFEDDSTSTMYEIDDIDDALANESSDEENDYQTKPEDIIVECTSPLVNLLENSLSEIEKQFGDLQLEFGGQENSEEQSTTVEICDGAQEIKDEDGLEGNSRLESFETNSLISLDLVTSNDTCKPILSPMSNESELDDDILYVDTDTNEIYMSGNNFVNSNSMFAHNKLAKNSAAKEKDTPTKENNPSTSNDFNLRVEEIFNIPTETALNFATTTTVDEDDGRVLVAPENGLGGQESKLNEKRIFMWPESSDEEVDAKRVKSNHGKNCDWESDSDSSSSSTSGEFDCSKNDIPRSRSWSGELYAARGSFDEVDEEKSEPIRVSTWNKDATPKRSSLKISPIKNSELKKSVSFKVHKRPVIYEYPKEKQWEEPNTNLMWNLSQNYNMDYADWELADEEMSSDVVDLEDFDEDARAKSTPIYRLEDQMLYKLSDISDEYDSIEDSDDIAFVDPLVGAITYRDLLEHYRSNQFCAPPDQELSSLEFDKDGKSVNAEKMWATKSEAEEVDLFQPDLFLPNSLCLNDVLLNNDQQSTHDSNDVIRYSDVILTEENKKDKSETNEKIDKFDKMNNAIESSTECNGNEQSANGSNEELLI